MQRILCAFLIACGVVWSTMAMGQEPATAQLRTITVTGEARVYVKPDEVILTAGVSEESGNLSEAKATVDKAGKAILEAVRKSAVPEKDIQTDNQQIYLRNDREENGTYSRRFVVSRSYRLTLRDATKMQGVYDAVVAAGANRIEGPNYQTSELRKYRDQARGMALKAAKEKAVAMARELGVAIGEVRTIREGVEQSWRAPMLNVQMQVQAAPGEDGESSTPLGQMAVSANVEVVFDLVK